MVGLNINSYTTILASRFFLNFVDLYIIVIQSILATYWYVDRSWQLRSTLTTYESTFDLVFYIRN
jgi:hypothetical protein